MWTFNHKDTKDRKIFMKSEEEINEELEELFTQLKSVDKIDNPKAYNIIEERITALLWVLGKKGGRLMLSGPATSK